MKKFLIILILFMFLVSSCEKDISKNGSDDENKDDKTKIEDVVKDMYKYANEFQYKKMKKYFTNTSSTDLEVTEIANEFVNERTKLGTVKDIEVIYVNVKAQNAVVRINKTFDDGSSKKSSEKLLIEDGKWKIIYQKEESDYVPISDVIYGIWYSDNNVCEIKKNTDERVEFIEYGSFINADGSLFSGVYELFPKSGDSSNIIGEWVSDIQKEAKITVEEYKDNKLLIKKYAYQMDTREYIGFYIENGDRGLLAFPDDTYDFEWDFTKGGFEKISYLKYIEDKGFEGYKKYDKVINFE